MIPLQGHNPSGYSSVPRVSIIYATAYRAPLNPDSKEELFRGQIDLI